MHIDYSTDTVDDAQRFAYWSDVVCQHLIPAKSVAVSYTHLTLPTKA